MRKEIGTLLVAGGIGLVWLLKKHVRGPRIHERFITLKSKAGQCGIVGRQEDIKKVVLRRSKGDQVHWIIRNAPNSGSACNRDVHVCIGSWEMNGRPVESPVVDRHNEGLCRTVPQPRTKPIHAEVKEDAPCGAYAYKVLIDGQEAIDPMVEIVV
jgi:hypothetical protein